MTSRQYGTLKYFLDHDHDLEHLGVFNLTTLGSLIHRGWVQKKGDRMVASNKGIEAWKLYHDASPVYRENEGPLTERVAVMLHINALRALKRPVKVEKRAAKVEKAAS